MDILETSGIQVRLGQGGVHPPGGLSDSPLGQGSLSCAFQPALGALDNALSCRAALRRASGGPKATVQAWPFEPKMPCRFGVLDGGVVRFRDTSEGHRVPGSLEMEGAAGLGTLLAGSALLYFVSVRSDTTSRANMRKGPS